MSSHLHFCPQGNMCKKDSNGLMNVLGTSLVGTAVWVCAIAATVAGYASLGSSRGRGIGDIPGDVIVFGAAFAAAFASAGFIVFTAGGQSRRAVVIVLGWLTFLGCTLGMGAILVFLTPGFMCTIARMNLWEYLQFRDDVA